MYTGTPPPGGPPPNSVSIPPPLALRIHSSVTPFNANYKAENILSGTGCDDDTGGDPNFYLPKNGRYGPVVIELDPPIAIESVGITNTRNAGHGNR